MERGQSGNRAETRSEMKTRGFAVVLAILLAVAYQIVSFWAGYYNNMFKQLGI